MKKISSKKNSIAVDGSGLFNRTSIYQLQNSSYSSKINILLESLIEEDDNQIDPPNALTAEADEKLDFNNIGHYREDIEEFSAQLSIVEEKIDTIDGQIPGSKARILKAIHQHYKNQKRDLLIKNNICHDDKERIILEIRKNSDYILNEISKKIIEHARPDFIDKDIETMQEVSNIVLCYGFVNCKIMENPNDYT